MPSASGSQPQQVANVGVVRAGGDDRVARRNLADGRGHARLDAGPAVGIVHLRLVQNLKEDAFRIAIGVVRGQLAPKHVKLLHLIVAAAQLLLVSVARVHVDLDGEAVGQNRIHGAIQAGDEIRIRPFRPVALNDCSSASASMLSRTWSKPSFAIRAMSWASV